MVSFKKTLLLAMASSAQSSPVSDKTTVAVAQGFTPHAVPAGAIDISNNIALIDEMKKKHGLEPAKDGQMTVMGGACNQGTCPDFDKAFDMMYTWTQITTPGEGGAPPTTLVWNDFVVRVNDCGKCYSHRVGSTHGGCYDFTACNRPQQICVDDGHNRAHRIWKDKNHKTCYRISQIGYGGCGPVKARVIFRPDGETACNW
ncbi:hypothetical protein QQS21_005693 [Conoideocrella luteorostrata]|uniref:Uncharacterized protein n=1 Tax=Conoideocrella luteorostrata TaxID=1105319 RepID=A0AAJ0CNX2_9HYPO|nr:hypothetical protein QQS21_005693 [Conoideocrella luteorostrata]